jgi:TfoX N-terminal domain
VAVSAGPVFGEEERRGHRVSPARRPPAAISSVLSQDVAERPVQRTGDAGGIERADEQWGVADLAVPHEAPQLLVERPLPMCRLPLVRAEGAELALLLDHRQYSVLTQGTDQLVLEVDDADEESKPLHVPAGQVCAQPRPLERAAEPALLSGVAKPAEAQVEPRRAEAGERAPDRLCAADRDHGHALGGEIHATPRRQRLDREPIADAFDEHDGAGRVGLAKSERHSAEPSGDALPYDGDMAYDEELAQRIRELVGDEPALSEQKMFGGLAFLIGGNMAIAASGQGGILVRADPEQSDVLVETTPASVMEMRGREMRGWLRVPAADVRSRDELAKWVELGTSYARSLPSKK